MILSLTLLFLFSLAVLPASADAVGQTLVESTGGLEGFLSVAEQYMGADIDQTGISASINEEGRLQITQVLSGPATCSELSVEQEKGLPFLPCWLWINTVRKLASPIVRKPAGQVKMFMPFIRHIILIDKTPSIRCTLK